MLLIDDDDAGTGPPAGTVGANFAMWYYEQAQRRGAAMAAAGDRLRAAIATHTPPMSDGALLGRPSVVIWHAHLGPVALPVGPGR